MSLYRGFEIENIVPSDDFVEVHATSPAGEADEFGPARAAESIVLRARYVIAADGGRSQAREQLGIERYDLPLGHRHQRFEWRLLPGKTAEQMSDPAVAWELLARLGLTADDLSIVRQHVWNFEAKIASQWSRGRVSLAGDAAHTMPPFQGQGMCSGIRPRVEARSRASRRLLPRAARHLSVRAGAHLLAWTRLSIETGKVASVLDPELAAARDEAFRTATPPPCPPSRP